MLQFNAQLVAVDTSARVEQSLIKFSDLGVKMTVMQPIKPRPNALGPCCRLGRLSGTWARLNLRSALRRSLILSSVFSLTRSNMEVEEMDAGK